MKMRDILNEVSESEIKKYWNTLEKLEATINKVGNRYKIDSKTMDQYKQKWFNLINKMDKLGIIQVSYTKDSYAAPDHLGHSEFVNFGDIIA